MSEDLFSEYVACHRNSWAIDWECTCGFDGNMDTNEFLRDIHNSGNAQKAIVRVYKF